MAEAPSLDLWLKEAKQDENAGKCGMYLFHNGIVRETPKAWVRLGEDDPGTVTGMDLSGDKEKTAAAIRSAEAMEGIYYVRVWLNEGRLAVGECIMQVLIGGDTRPHVVDALNRLVGELKDHCVSEKEIF